MFISISVTNVKIIVYDKINSIIKIHVMSIFDYRPTPNDCSTKNLLQTSVSKKLSPVTFLQHLEVFVKNAGYYFRQSKLK